MFLGQTPLNLMIWAVVCLLVSRNGRGFFVRVLKTNLTNISQAFHLAPLSHPLTSALWFRASENNLKYQNGPSLNKKIYYTDIFRWHFDVYNTITTKFHGRKDIIFILIYNLNLTETRAWKPLLRLQKTKLEVNIPSTT